MGDFAPIWSAVWATVSTYHAEITLAVIAACLWLSIGESRRLAEVIDALSPEHFSPPKRGRRASRIATMERQLREIEAYANNKWLEIFTWIVRFLTAGLVIPTLSLILFGLVFPDVFKGVPGFAILPPECKCAAPILLSSLNTAQLLDLLIAAMVPPDAIQFLPGWLTFSTTFNFDSGLMYVVFIAHKVFALKFTWEIVRDVLLRLPDLYLGSKGRVDEIKARIAQAKMELE